MIYPSFPLERVISTPEEGVELETDKNLAIFDIDGTLTQGFALFNLIRAQADVGLIRKDAEVLSSATNMELGISGKYEKALGRLLLQHARDLKDQSEDDVQRHADAFYSNKDIWLPFAKPTIEKLREEDFRIIIVSGGPYFAVEAAEKFLGVRNSFSSRYSTVDDEDIHETIFTGEVDHDLATSAKKGAIVLDQRRKLLRDHPEGVTLYHGDSDGDIFGLHLADGAFVVRPSIKVRQHTRQCGWSQIPESELRAPEPAPTVFKEIENLKRRRLLVLKPPRTNSY